MLGEKWVKHSGAVAMCLYILSSSMEHCRYTSPSGPSAQRDEKEEEEVVSAAVV